MVFPMNTITPESLGYIEYACPGTTFQGRLFTTPLLIASWHSEQAANGRVRARKDLERIRAGKRPNIGRRRAFPKLLTEHERRLAYIENVGHEPRTIERWGEVL